MIKKTASNFRIVQASINGFDSTIGAVCFVETEGLNTSDSLRVTVTVPWVEDDQRYEVLRKACILELKRMGFEYLDKRQEAQLHVLCEHTLHDVPKVLRALADSIEAKAKEDDFTVASCVVVWTDADGVQVSYSGKGEGPPNTVLALHQGLDKMMRVIEQGQTR